MSDNKAIAIFLGVAALIGVGYYLFVSKPADEKEKVSAKERRELRAKENSEALERGPLTADFELADGATVRVLRIPVPTKRYVNWATCFVYEKGSAVSLSCPGEPEFSGPNWPEREPDYTPGRP